MIETQKTKDVTEVVAQKQIKKEVKLIGSQRRVPGLTLWKFNTKTKEIDKAEFEKVDHKLNFNKTAPEIRYSVKIEQDCIYLQALNKKNAIKKVAKIV